MANGTEGNTFRVVGGRPISGVYQPCGNKNEALPTVAAAVLSEKPVTIENIPDIVDVRTMIQVAARLGVGVSFNETGSVVLSPASLCTDTLHPDMARTIRGSFLFTAPLLHRRGRAKLPKPGGDKIGRRRIDTHLLALRALGAEIEVGDTDYTLTLSNGFVGTDVFLDEASVMATENAVMAAAVAKGVTTIANAACEPHVQGLCRMLNAMGADVRGIGTNLLEVHGKPSLTGCVHKLGPDHIEIGSFLGLAAVTGGELTVKNVRADDLRMIRMVFRKLGIETELTGNDLFLPGGQTLEVQSDLHDAIPKIDDAPWPGFPADLVSIILVVATQAKGTVLIHEKLFESRMFFVDRLVSMGAKIVLCDPHRAVVVGPAHLHGETIASPDIRAGMAMLIAALCAQGESTIQNVRQIDRGYAKIDDRLRALGADLKRI